MAYRIGDANLRYQIVFKDKSDKSKSFHVIRNSQQVKHGDVVMNVNSFFKSKFNNKIVAFLVNHEGKIMKVVNNEGFFVKDFDELESVFPFKCLKVPFGKFVDYCKWDKNSFFFLKSNNVDDLYKNMLQELPHVNHLNNHFLQLEIFNRTIYSDNFEYEDAGVKKSQEGKYVEYGSELRELNNLDGFVNLEVFLNREIVTQDISILNKVVDKIKIQVKCRLVFDVIEGSQLNIKFGQIIPDVMISLEWCVLTCRNSPEKKMEQEMSLPFTVSSKIFTMSVVLRSGKEAKKKKK